MWSSGGYRLSVSETVSEALPLRYLTPARWVQQVMADSLALICDHAHLERKAASNALDLLCRWPVRVDLRSSIPVGGADRWVHVLTSIAQDELRHLAQVLRLLERRGGHLERSHQNTYAAALHGHIRRGRGPDELLDRLCVSALIEARSCERFELLATCREDEELAGLFASLCRSERGHYRAFLELGGLLPGMADAVAPRFAEWLDIEAEVAAGQGPGPHIHSGVD